MGPRPPIPGEHGAWAALLTGTGLGVALALQSGGSLGLALGASLAAVDLFVLREALYQAVRPLRARDPRRRATDEAARALARRWAAGELLLLLGVGLVLILATGQWWLAGVGVAALIFLGVFVALRRSRKEHTFWAEVVGFIGLSAACPVTYVLAASAQGGSLGHLPGAPWPGGLLAEAAILWLLLAAYFIGPVFYVRMKVAQQRERPSSVQERLRLGWGTLGYTLLVAGLLAWAGGELRLGPWPLLAFLPALGKNLVGILRVRLPLNLKAIGLAEVGLALLFAAGLFLGLGG